MSLPGYLAVLIPQRQNKDETGDQVQEIRNNPYLQKRSLWCMLSEDVRVKKIQGIEALLENMRPLTAKWQKDAEVPNAPSTDRFPYTCIKFMVQLAEQWLASEKEILETEMILRRYSAPKKARRKRHAPKKVNSPKSKRLSK